MAGKLFLCFFGVFSIAYSLELKQVLILSRHNLRTPLTNLQEMSPKTWIEWDYAAGELTNKGAILEGYLGDYFSEWLRHHGLINGCPDEDSVHIYANTKQRTKETAKAFVKSAFRDCDVPVITIHYTEWDPVFHPIIRNTTEAFKEQMINEMWEKLNGTDLRDSYLELNRITNIKESQICKEESYCDLANDKEDIVFEIGEEPNVAGPLSIGSYMADAFLMSYYEGFSEKDVAWGEIKNEDQWKLITRIVKHSLDVRFNLPKSASDLIKPLLQYMKKMLSTEKKFTLLVGHDSNLGPVITTLGFKSFTLPGQLEIYPIGAKLVFQRWSDGKKDFLKVEYVYGSSPQLRNAEKLSLSSPPNNITMYLNNLSDNHGFYSWSDFERLLQEVAE